MSLLADTTGRSLTREWEWSPEYIDAYAKWREGVRYDDYKEWENSSAFRNARYAYRKRVNCSEDKEST